MAALNTRCRANFDEWLQNHENKLQEFVFAAGTDEVSFGSNDSKLVYCGLSTAEPVGCHMIEARVNGQTENKQLIKLFKTSGSVLNDPSRLAFALFPPSMNGYCTGQHVRQALQESPVDGQSFVNKVHVQWGPDVKLEDGKPRQEANVVSFEYNKIPLSGYKMDGTRVEKKGKNGKK